MEKLFILLIVIAALIIVVEKNRKTIQIPPPELQHTIEQELMERAEDFLSCIDSAGLYPKFDKYIFQKACAWLNHSLEAGENVDYITCNFSRKTLSEANTAEELMKIADSYGISYGKMAIEITERERVSNMQQFLENLQKLHEVGFLIFLDDYGVGVTTLKDMIDYPLDAVKIDKSMLYETSADQGRAVYRTLVNVARELGLKVICEGIETEEQNSFAREAVLFRLDDAGMAPGFIKEIENDTFLESKPKKFGTIRM